MRVDPFGYPDCGDAGCLQPMSDVEGVVDLPEPMIPSTITSLGQTLLNGGIKVE